MIRDGKKGDVQDCVNLHMNALKEGLFYQLGEGILNKAYCCAASDKNSFLIVSEENGRIDGAALGAGNIAKFLSEIKSKYFFSLLFDAIKSVIVKPRLIPPILTSFFYSKGKEAELLFLFVSERSRRKGIGNKLIKDVDLKFKKLGVNEYRVTFLPSNRAAELFYRKNKFILKSSKKGRLIYTKKLC